MDCPAVAFAWTSYNWARFAWPVLAASGVLACAGSVPDPAPVAARFAEASRKGDHQAVYQLLSKQAQRCLGAERVKQLVTEQRSELANNANQLTAKTARTQVSIRARFVDGDTAMLAVEQGELRVESAAALPSHATTPQQALVELREVLSRRSYPGLLNVLTENSATGFEGQLQSLVEALGDAHSLQIEVKDERAVVTLPHGHSVELRKENGLWKVHDFE
jgi:hypothetical protein